MIQRTTSNFICPAPGGQGLTLAHLLSSTSSAVKLNTKLLLARLGRGLVGDSYRHSLSGSVEFRIHLLRPSRCVQPHC